MLSMYGYLSEVNLPKMMLIRPLNMRIGLNIHNTKIEINIIIIRRTFEIE